MALIEHENLKAIIMTDFNAILQYVNGKIYELKGLDSAFHIHEPNSDLIAFYGPEHYNHELFVQLKNGEKMIFEQVTEETMTALEPQDADADTVYRQFIDNKQPSRETDAELIPVDLQELLNVFCEMQYHITVTNGLWATDEPGAFKDHPARKLLWQVWFKRDGDQFKSYESRSGIA